MQAKGLSATSSSVECALHENHPLRLVGAEGRRVHCLSGVVWITAYNQERDVFLKAGDSYVIPTGRLVLAEAVGSGRMQVELPRMFDYSPWRTGLAVCGSRVGSQLRAAFFGRRLAHGGNEKVLRRT